MEEDNQLRDRIKEFFSCIDVTYPTEQGWCNVDDIDLLTNCLIRQINTGENKLKEYIDAKQKVEKYMDFDRFLEMNIRCLQWGYKDDLDNIKNKSINEIDYLLHNKEKWDFINDKIYKLEDTRRRMENIEKEGALLLETQREEKTKKKLDKYYKYIEVDCEEEIRQAKEAVKLLSTTPMNYVASKIASYPLILFVFNENRHIINMTKLSGNIERKLKDYNKRYPSYTYGYLSMNDRVVDYVFAELCVYYKPKDLTVAAFSSPQSPYKTIGVIKDRFKEEAGINLRTIKKVCELYKIEIHFLNDNVSVVHREKINKALSEYTGRNFN